MKLRSKKKTSSNIIVPSTEIITPDNPFDYLTSLKRGGLKSTHGEEFDPAALASSRIVLNGGNFDDVEIDIAKQIRETVDSKIIVPKDMKIDDGDLPTAANFYEWVTEDRFGAVDEERPFLEQLIWGIVTFNDACPRCSDNEWLYFDHKVDDSYRKFERKVSLMHHGVCPNCKYGRSELVNSGQMKFINELAVNAGQRCVIGSTPVLTEFGVLRISECAPDADYYFSDLEMQVHNGNELETTSHFYRAKPEPIYRVLLSNGISISGTADHPIMTSTGFVKLGEITEGTIVPVSYGQRCFGSETFESAFSIGARFNGPEVGKTIRTSNISTMHEFLRGMFQSKERAFLSLLAISDLSAMLFNLGIYHSIDGAAIILSGDGFAFLHGDGTNLPSGTELELVVSISIGAEQDTFDFTLPQTHQFVTGGITSHNSGKSHTIGGYLYPYLTHRMLMLQKPAQFYRLARTTVLHATFVALTYAQAKDTLWTPFYGAILSSQWFQQYHAMLKFYENKYGESLLKLNDTFVVYKPRGLMVYPAGPDKRVLRGRTRFGASIDEIAYFDSQKDSTKVKINAHEVYDAMTNSLYTLRAAAERLINNGYNDVFPGYSMNVTSPVARNDMIHTLLARAKDSESMYGIHRPTWEVNPDFPRNSRLIIEAYRKDPDSAEKNFGANPPLIANPFISNHDLIAGAEDRDRKNAVKIEIIMKTSRKQGQSYMYGEVKKVRKSAYATMMAIDAGLTDNSFAMAGGRPNGLNLQVDFATEVVPVKGFKINHSLVYSELILPVMEARNCKILLADRWNSIKLLDDAKLDMGDPTDDEDTFLAKQYSLKYRDMVSVRTCLEQGIIRLPKSEIKVSSLLEALDSEYRDFYDGKPIAHLFKQLHTIKDLEKQVGKGDGYTDDIWRALALLVWGLMEEEFQGILLAEPIAYEKTKPSALGFSRLYSGGGGTVGQGGGQATLINGAPLGVMARAKR